MKKVILTTTVASLLALAVGAGVGYWFGNTTGYEKGQEDFRATQEALAKKATEKAAKEANPFQAVNPLEGVNTNPFEDAQKALNPFE